MRLISHSPSDTVKIGKLIARHLKAQDIICLFGELGCGKTVLTKGIGQGLGIARTKINSPSFVLLRQYTQARLPFYHFDLYRLKKPQDILSLGYEEYLYAEGAVVIEWADRLKYLLPKEYLKVELFIRSDTQRLLEFSAYGAHYNELLERIHENIRH